MRRRRNRLPLPLASAGAVLATATILACCAASFDPGLPKTREQVLALALGRGLVEVSSVDPRIRTGLRYATHRNASGHILYPPGMPCLLREATARKLAKAQTYLEKHKLGILIWDAYRPPAAQQALWDLSGRLADFVGDPALGWSAHCTGTAIDITLVDLTGRPLPMPTDFDVFTQEASAFYTGENLEIRRRMRLLHKAMRHAGLKPYVREWWHFSDPDFQPLAAHHVVFANGIGLRMPAPQAPPTNLPSTSAR